MSDATPLDRATADALAAGTLADPFAVLGPHGGIVRAFLPGARSVEAVTAAETVTLDAIDPPGLFAGPVAGPYRLRVRWPDSVQETEDPYAFGPLLGDLDLHLIAEGRHFRLTDALGSHPLEVGGTAGVRFAVWAPNAARVAVVGDFNAWDTRRHPMRLRHGSGVWELFVPASARASATNTPSRPRTANCCR